VADIRHDPADLEALHAFGVRNLPVLARGSKGGALDSGAQPRPISRPPRARHASM
jgi:hypothetical protein